MGLRDTETKADIVFKIAGLHHEHIQEREYGDHKQGFGPPYTRDFGTQNYLYRSVKPRAKLAETV